MRDASGDGVAVLVVISAAAGGAWAVAGGESDGVIKEEQWRPSARSSKGHAPASELCLADDPELTAVVADDTFVIIDDTAAISCKQTAAGFAV